MIDKQNPGYNQHAQTKSKRDTERNLLNPEEEDEMEISGYKFNSMKNTITVIFSVVTCGLLRLIFHWYPHWMLICTHVTCPLKKATKVLIKDRYKGAYKTYFVKDVNLLKTNKMSPDEILDFRLSNGKLKGKIDAEMIKNDKMTIFPEMCEIRVIWCKKMCYVWDIEENRFIKLAGAEVGVKNIELRNCKGLSKIEQDNKRVIYGENEILVPVNTVLTLLVLEALTPFYMFQVFSLIVWFCESYYYYTIAIIVMSVYGITSSIIQTRRNQKNLKGTVHSIDKVTVRRKNGEFEDIQTNQLVPGDVIIIPSHGCVMQCDAILLNGNCIVNESMLTGESVPVTKTPLPATDIMYNSKNDCNHTLFCGTKVIQTRYYGEEKVLALVIRTGFLTSKGQLVKSIMYPPPADFKFDQDSYKFIAILAVFGAAGVIYTVVSKSTRHISPVDILLKSLDLITIAVPPALPAAMTVGKLYALSRLKKNKVYCMNSRVINVSGSINCICFDKTGTLTEDGLDMWGVVPVINGNFQNVVKNIDELSNSPLIQGMAVCHSLTRIDNEIIGDPLDVKIFESTGWILEEPEISDSTKYDQLVPTIVKFPNITEIGIVHQLQFSSNLQRMSVITRTLGAENFEIFCKGSPEMLIGLSKSDSVPKNVLTKLSEFTEKGYRVIGMGKRILENNITYTKLQKLQRDEIERDLIFLGLIILENQLKPNTASVIKTLKDAEMKIIMITGDNIQTALSVAKESDIIENNQVVIDVSISQENKLVGSVIKYTILNKNDTINYNEGDIFSAESGHISNYCFALTGSTWEAVRKSHVKIVPQILAKGSVFARCTSNQKQQLVEELQSLGYYVAMCGDGANDCGALKAAHVGVSLSEAESSVASPFTAQDSNIDSVIKIIREGRAALVTSFGVFKFMFCYSITELTSTLILYSIDSNLTSLQFLFIDIFLVLTFASFFGKTEAYDGPLAKTPPMASLIGFIPLASIISIMIINIIFQTLAYYMVKTYNWFEPFIFDPNKDNYFSCYENTAVFTVSMFQYITAVVVFSKGKPYRKTIFTNWSFLWTTIVMTIICCYITLYPAQWLVDLLEIKQPPALDGPVAIILLALGNFLSCLLFEDFVIGYILQKVKKHYYSPNKSRKKYLAVRKQINSACDSVSIDVKTAVIFRNDKEVPKKHKRCHSNEAFEIDERTTKM